jgi:hypothetical protein
MKQIIKSALMRFLRGFIAGGIGAMALILPVGIQNFNDLSSWLVGLLLAGLVGAISGGIQALDKYFRDSKNE